MRLSPITDLFGFPVDLSCSVIEGRLNKEIVNHFLEKGVGSSGLPPASGYIFSHLEWPTVFDFPNKEGNNIRAYGSISGVIRNSGVEGYSVESALKECEYLLSCLPKRLRLLVQKALSMKELQKLRGFEYDIILVIDTPEYGTRPDILARLDELIRRNLADKFQVFLFTHSPILLTHSKSSYRLSTDEEGYHLIKDPYLLSVSERLKYHGVGNLHESIQRRMNWAHNQIKNLNFVGAEHEMVEIAMLSGPSPELHELAMRLQVARWAHKND